MVSSGVGSWSERSPGFPPGVDSPKTMKCSRAVKKPGSPSPVIAQSVSPDGGGRTERIVRWDCAVGAVAQDLAAHVCCVQRRRGRVLVSERHVEHAIGTEGEPAALVTAVWPGRQRHQDGGIGARSTAIAPAHDVLLGVVHVRIEGIDETVLLKVGLMASPSKPRSL